MSSATKATEATVEANGLHFQYREWADTRTKHAIITLHGYAETKSMWEETAQDLAREYRVIALDQRGHGGRGVPLARC